MLIPVMASRSIGVGKEEGNALVWDTETAAPRKKKADQEPAANWVESLPTIISQPKWPYVVANTARLVTNHGTTMKAYAEMERNIGNAGRKSKEELSLIEKSGLASSASGLFKALHYSWNLSQYVVQLLHAHCKGIETLVKNEKDLSFSAKFLSKMPVNNLLKGMNRNRALYSEMLNNQYFFAEFGNDTHNRMLESVGRLASGKDGYVALSNSIVGIVNALASDKVQKYVSNGDDSIVLDLDGKRQTVTSLQQLMEETVKAYYDYCETMIKVMEKSFVDSYTGKGAK